MDIPSDWHIACDQRSYEGRFILDLREAPKAIRMEKHDEIQNRFAAASSGDGFGNGRFNFDRDGSAALPGLIPTVANI